MASFTTRQDNCFANDYSSFIQTSDDMPVQDVSMDESLDRYDVDSIEDVHNANVLRSPFTPMCPHVECVMGPMFTLNESIAVHEDCSPIDNCSTSSQSVIGQNVRSRLKFRPSVTIPDDDTFAGTTAVSLDSCMKHQSRIMFPVLKSDTEYVAVDFDERTTPNAAAAASIPLLPDFNDDSDTDDEIIAEYNHRVPYLHMRPSSRRLDFLG